MLSRRAALRGGTAVAASAAIGATVALPAAPDRLVQLERELQEADRAWAAATNARELANFALDDQVWGPDRKHRGPFVRVTWFDCRSEEAIREVGTANSWRPALASETEIERALAEFRAQEAAYSEAREQHGLVELDRTEEAAKESAIAIERELCRTVPTTPEGIAVKLRRIAQGNGHPEQLAETALEGFERLVGRTFAGPEKV